jgi:hypothetical protein
MFEVSREDNGFECVEGVGGYTRSLGYGYRSGDPKFYKGTMSLTGLSLLISWGVCDQGAERVDESLSNITSLTDATMLKLVLESIDSTEGPVAGPYCVVPVAEAHEAVHISQLMERLTKEYNAALDSINILEPIEDWCRMSEEELLLAQIQELKKIDKFLTNAKTRFEIRRAKDTETKLEPAAYEAGYNKAREIIKKLKKQFPDLL